MAKLNFCMKAPDFTVNQGEERKNAPGIPSSSALKAIKIVSKIRRTLFM